MAHPTASSDTTGAVRSPAFPQGARFLRYRAARVSGMQGRVNMLTDPEGEEPGCPTAVPASVDAAANKTMAGNLALIEGFGGMLGETSAELAAGKGRTQAADALTGNFEKDLHSYKTSGLQLLDATKLRVAAADPNSNPYHLKFVQYDAGGGKKYGFVESSGSIRELTEAAVAYIKDGHAKELGCPAKFLQLPGTVGPTHEGGPLGIHVSGMKGLVLPLDGAPMSAGQRCDAVGNNFSVIQNLTPSEASDPLINKTAWIGCVGIGNYTDGGGIDTSSAPTGWEPQDDLGPYVTTDQCRVRASDTGLLGTGGYALSAPFKGVEQLKQAGVCPTTCEDVACGKCVTGCRASSCVMLDGTQGYRNKCACNIDGTDCGLELCSPPSSSVHSLEGPDTAYGLKGRCWLARDSAAVSAADAGKWKPTDYVTSYQGGKPVTLAESPGWALDPQQTEKEETVCGSAMPKSEDGKVPATMLAYRFDNEKLQSVGKGTGLTLGSTSYIDNKGKRLTYSAADAPLDATSPDMLYSLGEYGLSPAEIATAQGVDPDKSGGGYEELPRTPCLKLCAETEGCTGVMSVGGTGDPDRCYLLQTKIGDIVPKRIPAASDGRGCNDLPSEASRQLCQVPPSSELFVRGPDITAADGCPKSATAVSAYAAGHYMPGGAMTTETQCGVNSTLKKLRSKVDQKEQVLHHATDELGNAITVSAKNNKLLRIALAKSAKNTASSIDDSMGVQDQSAATSTNLEEVVGMMESSHLQMVSNNYQYFAWGTVAVLLVAAGIKATR